MPGFWSDLFIKFQQNVRSCFTFSLFFWPFIYLKSSSEWPRASYPYYFRHWYSDLCAIASTKLHIVFEQLVYCTANRFQQNRCIVLLLRYSCSTEADSRQHLNIYVCFVQTVILKPLHFYLIFLVQYFELKMTSTTAKKKKIDATILFSFESNKPTLLKTFWIFIGLSVVRLWYHNTTVWMTECLLNHCPICSHFVIRSHAFISISYRNCSLTHITCFYVIKHICKRISKVMQ